MYYPMLTDLVKATFETLYMVSISTLLTIAFGLPLGTLVYSASTIRPQPKLFRTLSFIINSIRSIPFIILLVALIPVTRLIVGTSIGMNAAIVPLTIGATPFFARLVDNIYQSLPSGLIETGFSMGANTRQIITHFLLPEARPALIQSITVTVIALINYSAMAGVVGAGGLGTLAINYGYQRFDATVMVSTVLILMGLVQFIQVFGDHLSNRYNHT